MAQPDDFDDDEEFPVLTEVVKAGDAKVIDAARRAHEKKGVVTHPIFDHAPLTPAQISRSITAPEPTEFDPLVASGETRLQLSATQIEKLIDEIVIRHAEQMRAELLSILKHQS